MFFVTREKIESQANIPECAVVISGMKINQAYGLEIYVRNKEKIFPAEGGRLKKNNKVTTQKETLQEMVAETIKGEQQSPCDDNLIYRFRQA